MLIAGEGRVFFSICCLISGVGFFFFLLHFEIWEDLDFSVVMIISCSILYEYSVVKLCNSEHENM